MKAMPADMPWRREGPEEDPNFSLWTAGHAKNVCSRIMVQTQLIMFFSVVLLDVRCILDYWGSHKLFRVGFWIGFAGQIIILAGSLNLIRLIHQIRMEGEGLIEKGYEWVKDLAMECGLLVVTGLGLMYVGLVISYVGSIIVAIWPGEVTLEHNTLRLWLMSAYICYDFCCLFQCVAMMLVASAYGRLHNHVEKNLGLKFAWWHTKEFFFMSALTCATALGVIACTMLAVETYTVYRQVRYFYFGSFILFLALTVLTVTLIASLVMEFLSPHDTNDGRLQAMIDLAESGEGQSLLGRSAKGEGPPRRATYDPELSESLGDVR